MNEVKRARLEGDIRREIRDIVLHTVYSGTLQGALDDFKAEYLRNNAREASHDEENAFLSKSYIRDSVWRETNAVIDALTDALIRLIDGYIKPDGWSTTWRILGGIAILPCIYGLFSYAWNGYAYLSGAESTLDTITRGSVIEAFVTGTILLVLVIAAFVHDCAKSD